MTKDEIYETLKEQFPRYTEARPYRQKRIQFIERAQWCDRADAMCRYRNFLEAAVNRWDIFGILAAYDLYTERKNGK